MTNELKQEYLELYNAMELLDESDMISDVIYRAIAFKLLRTIMGHFAVECNKTKDASPTESESEGVGGEDDE